MLRKLNQLFQHSKDLLSTTIAVHKIMKLVDASD